MLPITLQPPFLDGAERCFAPQIRFVQARQAAQELAFFALSPEIALQRGAFVDQRENVLARLEMDAVDRDFVYVSGKVTN